MLAEILTHPAARRVDSPELDIDRLVHDLRGPLAVIIAFAEILEGAQREERARYTERVVGNAHKALAVLEEFSALHDLRRGTVEVQSAPLELGAVVRQACEAAADGAGGGIPSSCGVAGGKLEIIADRELLEMAMRAVLRSVRRQLSGQTTSLRVRIRKERLFVCIDILGGPGEVEQLVVDGAELEILERVVALHGGRLFFDDTDPGLVLRITLPQRLTTSS